LRISYALSGKRNNGNIESSYGVPPRDLQQSSEITGGGVKLSAHSGQNHSEQTILLRCLFKKENQFDYRLPQTLGQMKVNFLWLSLLFRFCYFSCP
jgi:hypothetical protein